MAFLFLLSRQSTLIFFLSSLLCWQSVMALTTIRPLIDTTCLTRSDASTSANSSITSVSTSFSCVSRVLQSNETSSDFVKCSAHATAYQLNTTSATSRASYSCLLKYSKAAARPTLRVSLDCVDVATISRNTVGGITSCAMKLFATHKHPQSANLTEALECSTAFVSTAETPGYKSSTTTNSSYECSVSSTMQKAHESVLSSSQSRVNCTSITTVEHATARSAIICSSHTVTDIVSNGFSDYEKGIQRGAFLLIPM